MLKKVSIFTVLLIVLLPLGLFLFLKNGIKIDNLSLANVNISQLYLKLDKKLIFTVKTLEVLPSQKEDSTNDFDPSIIFTVDELLEYLALAKIEDLSVSGQHLFLELKQKRLFVKHEKGEATIDIKVLDGGLLLDLKAKSYEYGSKLDAILNAKINTLSTKLYKPIVFLDATATHKKLKVGLKASLKNAKLRYSVKTNEIKSLDFINDFTKLEPKVQKLIDEFKFSSIKIEKLNGEQDIQKVSNFDLNSIDAKVSVEDIDFKYENYPNISQKAIDAEVLNGKVNLQLTENKKEKSLSLTGNINLTLDGKKIDLDTNIFYKDIVLKTDFSIKDDILDYEITSNKFKNIKDFEDFVEIPSSIRTWAIERLSSKAAKIDNISGRVYLDPLNINLQSLRVKARVYNILMDFNPKVAYPLNADVVYLEYDGKDMNIDLDAPRSNDVNLDGSDAVIYDMLSSTNGLLLRLQAISPINWTLVRAVKSYDVNIPNDLGLRQLKGSSDIKAIIDIPFTDAPVDVYVRILNSDSTMKIKDKLVDFETFDFLYKDKKVFVKNTLAKYENYNANIKDMLFDISKSELNINLNAYDDNKTFNIDLENKTSLEENTTKGNIGVNFVDIKDVVDMKNETIPYNAIFKKDIEVNLPSLEITYNKKRENHHFKAENLEKFKKYIIPMKQAGIKNSSVEIESFGLDYIDFKLYADGAMDENKTYEFDLLSNIDLENNTTNGFLRFYDFKYDDKIDWFGTDIPFEASFKKDINATLPSLGIDYKNINGVSYININSIKNITSMIDMLDEYESKIPKGNIYLVSKDFKDVNATLNLDVSDLVVYHNNVKQNSVSLDLKVKDQKYITFKEKTGVLKGDITLNEKPIINIKTNGLGVLHEDRSESSKSSDTNTSVGCELIDIDLPIVTLDMKNGFFRYNDNRLYYDNMFFNTHDGKRVTLDYHDKNTTITADIYGHNVDIVGKKLTEEFINSKVGKKVIDGGTIDLSIKGTQCNLGGEVNLKGVTIKDAAVLSNVFLVVNSLPAAINPYLIIPNAYALVTDGFELNQYKIKEGHLKYNFNRYKNIVELSSLETIGVYNSFYGKAMVDLNKQTIDATLDVGFMKTFGDIISYIPVVGYWMLGDDERFSYSVSVYGDIEDPEVETHFIKETTMAPVNIVKRIVTYPAKLVEYATSEDNNSTK